jgi:hypothetical protein
MYGDAPSGKIQLTTPHHNLVTIVDRFLWNFKFNGFAFDLFW